MCTPQRSSQLEPAPAAVPFTNWALGLIIAQVSPISLADIGFEYFHVFLAFNVLAIICYTIVYPDTKGKTLEQMDQLFGDQVLRHALQDQEAAAQVMAAKFSVSEHIEGKE